VPIGPDVGTMAIEEITMNEAVGRLVPSVTSTVFDPETEGGTEKAQPRLMPPVESVEHEVGIPEVEPS